MMMMKLQIYMNIGKSLFYIIVIYENGSEGVRSGFGWISDSESVLDEFASFSAPNFESHTFALFNLVVKTITFLHFHGLQHLRLQPYHQSFQSHHRHPYIINYTLIQISSQKTTTLTKPNIYMQLYLEHQFWRLNYVG